MNTPTTPPGATAQRPHATTRRTLPLLSATLLALLAPAAHAQFGVPGSTDIRERVAGQLSTTNDAPTPEPGDQIGAFTPDGTLVGRQQLSTDDPTSFRFVIFGDVPDTDPVEGAAIGQRIEFRFYDASRNETFPLTILNANNEPFNYVYQGEEIPPLPDLPGVDLDDLIVPVASINLQLGTSPNNGNNGGGNNGGDGGGGGGGNPDVDGDGKVTTKDAAIVLRFVVGARVAGVPASRADVNGDGTVDTDDAVEVLRRRND